MSKIPYHKMLVELDGQEAEIIIRALQLYISKESSINRSFKVTFYNNLILRIRKKKTEFHSEWKKYILNGVEYEADTEANNDMLPLPF
ncbi:hypothetical protein [Bacillus horti]|uniref:Uncharacterized protein n=1 Tax=Caldalkalibacillus horti TaxID=77523 RepID=A0ABT9VX33_9BACI|nr:hypothetical protein [Bacillus horti]MDQ0165551.1 hypothetical protein [Bacillus horti]